MSATILFSDFFTLNQNCQSTATNIWGEKGRKKWYSAKMVSILCTVLIHGVDVHSRKKKFKLIEIWGASENILETWLSATFEGVQLHIFFLIWNFQRNSTGTVIHRDLTKTNLKNKIRQLKFKRRNLVCRISTNRNIAQLQSMRSMRSFQGSI